jgi:hypothetical protein
MKTLSWEDVYLIGFVLWVIVVTWHIVRHELDRLLDDDE